MYTVHRHRPQRTKAANIPFWMSYISYDGSEKLEEVEASKCNEIVFCELFSGKEKLIRSHPHLGKV